MVLKMKTNNGRLNGTPRKRPHLFEEAASKEEFCLFSVKVVQTSAGAMFRRVFVLKKVNMDLLHKKEIAKEQFSITPKS